MSKRAIAFIVMYVTGLALSVTDPFFALLTYLLDYYNHPPLRWWGNDLPDLRWSFIPAMALLVMYLFYGRNPFDRRIFRHPQTLWLLAFLIIAALVTPWAVDYERSLHYLGNLAELTLLVVLIIGTVRTPTHYRLFIYAMLAGSLIWGVDAYLDPKRDAARLVGVGGPDSLNDNSAASHLLTALPFAAVLWWSGRWKEKTFALATAVFTINTIILCNSRGATLGFLSGALLALAIVPSELRRRFVTTVAVGGLAFMALADPQFFERQASLTIGVTDSSGSQRLESWKGAIRLVRDHPLGTGGGGYDALSPVYIPEIVESHEGELRAVHNTFLWVASDWGIPGFICFAAFVVSVFVGLHRIRRRTTDLGARLDSFALEVGLLSFLVSAVFLNRAYAEILYWIAGLTAARLNMVENVWAEDEEPATASTPWTRATEVA